MAHERAAFESRNVRIIGISADSIEETREFAATYSLPFPLISDPDNQLSRIYVGIDSDGYALPGVVVVAPVRKVVFRQVGGAPGDRVYAGDLLEVVDRFSSDIGTRATVAGLSGGFAPLERIQLRLAASLGLAQRTSPSDDLGFSVGGEVAVLYPLGNHVMLGALLRGLAVDSTHIDTDALLRLRFPVLYQQAELYVQIPFGPTVHATNEDGDSNEQLGWNGGVQTGLQFSLLPSMAIFLEGGASLHRFAGRGSSATRTELRYTAGGGVGFLF
ncbi:MAG: redoxin domain-containing protein [Proteobacteria bacterium]|nr:redoxin domain-containing protein [Pseudomonadota bacterium]